MIYLVMEGNNPGAVPYWRKVRAVCKTRKLANELVKEYQKFSEYALWHEPWKIEEERNAN